MIPIAVSLWALLLLIETLKHTTLYQDRGIFLLPPLQILATPWSSNSDDVWGVYWSLTFRNLFQTWHSLCTLLAPLILSVFKSIYVCFDITTLGSSKNKSLSITSFCIAPHTEEIFIFSSVFKFCLKIHLCGSWIKLFRIKLVGCCSWCPSPSHCPSQDSIHCRTGKLIQNGHGPSLPS